MMRVLFEFLRAFLVTITGHGYDRSPRVNDLHHKLAYRLHKLLPRFGIVGEQTIPVPGVPFAKMIVRAEDGGVAHHLLMYRQYEPYESALVREHIHKGDVVYVIGANIGYYPILCASFGAEVYAFEPDATNFDLLTRSIVLNSLSRVHALPFAIGNHNGGTVLSQSPTNSGDHQTGEVTGRTSVAVPIRSLDSLIDDGLPAPNVILMDVQSAELEVLRGARRLLEQMELRVIFTECWPGGLERREKGGSRAMIELLKSGGFTLRTIDERDKKLQPLDAKSLETMNDYEEINLLCERRS